MAKLSTKGTATMEFDAEIMKFKIIFEEKGTDVASTLGKVQKQTEQFLGELMDIGINPENVTLEDEGVSGAYNSDNYKAKKVLIIESKINSKICAYICSMIKKYDANIKYDIEYKLVNDEEVLKEVLQAAVENSRHQAEIIADSLGMKVISVDSVNEDLYIRRNIAKSVTVEEREIRIPEFFKSDTPLSDRAGIPKISKSEETVITWIVN